MVGAASVLIGLLAWWIGAAGALTVFRIIYYNKTGIEDFRVFASRGLHASNNPATIKALMEGGQGLSSELVARLERMLPATDTVGFLVVRGKQVLFERYHDGWTRSSLSQSFSMGKSFVSMLIGAAIDDGYIHSVNDPATGYIPELA